MLPEALGERHEPAPPQNEENRLSGGSHEKTRQINCRVERKSEERNHVEAKHGEQCKRVPQTLSWSAAHKAA